MNYLPSSTICCPPLQSHENNIFYDNFSNDIRFIDDTAFDLMHSTDSMPLPHYQDTCALHPCTGNYNTEHPSCDMLFKDCTALDSIVPIESIEHLFPEAHKTSTKVIQIQKRAIKAHNEIVQKYMLACKREMDIALKHHELFDVFGAKPETLCLARKAELMRELADCLLSMQDRVLEAIRKVVWKFVLSDARLHVKQGCLGRLKGLHKAAEQILEAVFENNPFPTDEERSHVAIYCDLSLHQVNSWFASKRNYSKMRGVFDVGQ